MLLPFWNFVRNSKNRDIISWLGGGSVAAVAGIWAVLTYFLPLDKKPDGSRPILITQSGPGIASGRDTVVNAPVAIGLDEKQVGQRVAEAQQPLTNQLEKLAAEVAREKGVKIAPLRSILKKLGEDGVADQDIPKRLEEAADELITLREQVVELRRGPPELAPFAQAAQALIDKGDLGGTRAILAFVDHYVDHYRRTGDRVSKLAELNAAAPELVAAVRNSMARQDYAAVAQTLIPLGDIHRMQGRWEPALTAYRMAETFARHVADPTLIARALRTQAMVESSQRDYGRAREHAEAALALSRALPDKKLFGDVLLVLVGIQVGLSDFAAAADGIKQAMTIAEERGDDEQRFYVLLERAGMGTGSCDAAHPTERCLQQIELALQDYAQGRALATRLGWSGLVREMEGFISRAESMAQLVRSKLALQGSRDQPAPLPPRRP
jgi:tetratricopeptide (TPR) repeat protein